MTMQNERLPRDEETNTADGAMLRQGVRAPLILAFIAIAAGLFSVLFLAGPGTPGESSVEAGFARDMMMHHSQATEMAEIVRRNTEDNALYALVSEIVIVQQTQIGQMRAWLALWDLPEEGKNLPMTWMGHPTSGLMPGMASSEQLSRLASLPQAEMEIEFLRLMIPHHQSGVEMAQALLDRTRNPEVRQLAHDVMAGQGPEMMVMQDMLVLRGQPRVEIPTEGGSGGHAGHADTNDDSGSSMETGQIVPRTLRFAPWTLAVFALAWLAWKVVPFEKPGSAASAPMIVTAAALVAGAAVQAGFIVGQSYEYAAYALIASLAATIAAAAVIVLPSLRPAALTGMVTSSLLIALYVVLRVASPLESNAPAGSSLAGVASAALFALALAACLYTLLTSEDEDDARAS